MYRKMHIIRVFCWLLAVLMIVFSTQPIALYASTQINSHSESKEKTIVFEKKNDATTPKAGISIRFTLSTFFHVSSPFEIKFTNFLNEDVKKTVILALTPSQTDSFVSFLRILFRYYIAVNAP